MKVLIKVFVLLAFISHLCGCSSTPDSSSEESSPETSAELENETDELADAEGIEDFGEDDDDGYDDEEDYDSEDYVEESEDFGDEVVSNENELDQELEDASQLSGQEEDFSTEDLGSDEGEFAVEQEVDNLGEPVRITGLDFKANDGGGTVVISTTGNPSFTSRKEAGANQYIVEVQNAQLPEQFKRPYNTKEFSSPVGFIRAYQNPGSTTARVVIQLKENVEMFVQQEGNSLLVMPSFEGAQIAENVSVEQGGDSDEEAPGVEIDGTQVEAPVQSSKQIFTTIDEDKEGKILSAKTLDDFLTGTTRFYGRPLSIQVKDREIRDVFDFIAEESGLNIVLADDVQGKVTLKLRKIPWDQALIILMQSRQLGYIRQGNILRISTLEKIRQETDQNRTVMESRRLLKPLRIKVFPISYAKVNEMLLHAKQFLSQRGKAQADVRTNSLIVTDISENLEKIGRLMERLDTQTPQVMIEGKIVEARETFERRIGINWNLGFINTIGNGDEATGSVDLSVTGAPSQFRYRTSVLEGGTDVLDASLQLLETENVVRVLSSPRIVALSNEEAKITQSTQIPQRQVTVNGNSEQVTFTFREIKLELKVTPQITSDGGIILTVDIIREFTQLVDPTDPTGARTIEGRNAKTKILVTNGETAVIGGIYQSDISNSVSRVPILGEIPLIGNLFKSKSIDKQKNELIIFLTPRIMNPTKI